MILSYMEELMKRKWIGILLFIVFVFVNGSATITFHDNDDFGAD